MAESRRLVLELVGDDRQLSRAFKKAGTEAQSFESKMMSVGKGAALAAGAAGLGAIVGTLKLGYDEWKESTLVAAQTEAALKSTGAAAGVTAQQISDLAGALMKKSGVDDEAIQKGENLLLTFTSIQNKVGEGNDIFNQATKTMLDMSVALGQDMKSSAIQLGKALNDPTAGMSALRRVGVAFTEEQKQMISKLQESGDVMGAQKIILAELTKEFGGSAEAAGKTLPGQLNVLKETFNNVAGQVFTRLVPALQSIATWVTEHMPQIQAGIEQAFDVMGQVIDALRPVIELVGKALRNFFLDIRDMVKLVSAIFHGDWSEAWSIAVGIVKRQLEFLKDLITTIADPIIKAATAIGTGIKNGIVSGLTGLADLIVGLVKVPINAVIDAINGLRIPSIHIKVGKEILGKFIGVDFDTPEIDPIPDIPHLAVGGRILSDGLAMIHQGEAVIPAARVAALPAPLGTRGNAYHFNFPNYMGDHREIATAIRDELARLERRGG